MVRPSCLQISATQLSSCYNALAIPELYKLQYCAWYINIYIVTIIYQMYLPIIFR